MSTASYTTQNDLLLTNLMDFYKNQDNLHSMLKIITGESKISLRIVDWFVTNYAKKYYTLYSYEDVNGSTRRFKVYVDYKLKLKAYSKARFAGGIELAYHIRVILLLKLPSDSLISLNGRWIIKLSIISKKIMMRLRRI